MDTIINDVNPLEHGRAAWKQDIGVLLLADVYVTLHVALERSVVESTGLNANEIGWKNTRAKKRPAPREMMWMCGVKSTTQTFHATCALC